MAIDRYQITENDRLSQMFDMTFDLSAFDMFISWQRGAFLCCPSQKTLIKPGGFIQEMQLTLWFSVPSTAVFMKRLRMLKAGRYPNLRWSLFCGEPLPMEVADRQRLHRAVRWAAPVSYPIPHTIILRAANSFGQTDVSWDLNVYHLKPPSAPTGGLELTYHVKTPSTVSDGQGVLYTYVWSSDKGDRVTHGPTIALSDTLTEMDLVQDELQ